MKTNHRRGFVSTRKSRHSHDHGTQLLKDASDENRRAAERQGISRILAGAEPELIPLPVKNAEAGNRWDFD